MYIKKNGRFENRTPISQTEIKIGYIMRVNWFALCLRVTTVASRVLDDIAHLRPLKPRSQTSQTTKHSLIDF